ncbi:MAG TPA: glycosidase [Planctomycetes bacterium]|nr:glycosidase [Planctomycetota bacterium]
MALNSNYELFERYPDNPILSVDKWPYKANSVFNAAAAKLGDDTILLARVEDYRGISHLTAAKSTDGITDWQIDPNPTFKPEPEKYPEEIWGIEDPRITWIEQMNKWAVCYTSYSKGGPLVSLAMTEDFKTFQRLGPVMPPEDKDAALFPLTFNGLWAMLHRPTPRSALLGAHIWISFSPNLKHWGEHQEIIRAREGGWWDANKIGLCAPPMHTDSGWLVLYHGVRTTASGSIYRLGLALLDPENPTKLIRRTDEWIFGPKTPYEREGDVDDVVFPCGWIKKDGKVFIYYGAADSRICLATADFQQLLDFVLKCPHNDCMN